MKVRDAITIRLQTASNFRDGTRIRHDIEQHRSRVADQPPSPSGDDGRANDPNKRIDPGPAKRPSQAKTDDRENRGCGIRQNVDVGCTKVAVGLAVMMIASIVVAMIVRAVMVAMAILKECTAEHPDVLKQPPPAVQLSEFGATAMSFDIFCIVPNLSDRGRIKSDIQLAILRRFREAGIDMTPAQDVRL